jgi:serine/threonine protein kinase
LPIAHALEYAPQRNFVHRDVKPANILLTETSEPMLSDFGIAKILETDEATLTGSGVGIGTPEYMSPEQSMGRGVDQRTDIYALGMVFYELVNGRKAYTADTHAAVLIKQVTEPLPRPKTFVPDLRDEVELAIFKALAKNPEDRYLNMGEFANAKDAPIVVAARKGKVDLLVTFDQKHLLGKPEITEYIKESTEKTQ